MNCNEERLKQMSLESLCLFDEFCREHKLQYTLAQGTELGRVRHGGFIPWDDDVDIEMPIADYKKFAKLFPKYGGKMDCFLQTKQNELYKPVLFFQLRKNGTTWIEPGKENVPMHWGIAIIDIFPVYNAPKSETLRKCQEKLYSLASEFCFFAYNNPSASCFKKNLSRFISLSVLKAVSLISCLNKKSPFDFMPEAYENRKFIEKTAMFPPVEAVFEGRKFSGHKDADKYLTLQYGDYMTPPPENERTGHAAGIIDLDKDYTFYIKK